MTHSYIYKSSITLLCFLLWILGVNGQGSPSGSLADSLSGMQEGTVSETDFSTRAFTTISGDDLMDQYAGSITNALIGKLSGLHLGGVSGEPGTSVGFPIIRGYGSLNDRSIKIYIDGFESSISYLESLSPSEIDQITVLKDAAALATFGMRGANGVLWVTTRQGEIGKTKVDFTIKTGIQQAAEIYKPLRSYDFARYYNEAKSNDNRMVWSPKYTDAELQAYQNGTGTDVDWYDESLKDRGAYTDANLSFHGGGEHARYFAYFGYLNNKGIYNVPTNDETANATQNRYNVRLNLDFNMFSIVEGKVGVGGNVDDRKSPDGSQSDLWIPMATYPSNIYPVQNTDGSWTGTSIYPDNPVARMNAMGYNSTHDRSMQGSFSLKEKLDAITPGLYIGQMVNFFTWTRGTYNRTRTYARVIDGVVQTPDQNTNYTIFDDNGTNQYNSKHFTGIIGYSRTFDRHALKGEVNYLIQNSNVDASYNGAAGTQTKYNYQNIGGYLNYTYNRKYMAELGFAFSGSDNFAEGNRWGLFPSLSVAWDISMEDFLNDNSKINTLRLRASAGKTGNDAFNNASRYQFMEYYGTIGIFRTGQTSIGTANGLGLLYTPNEEIFAEESMKYNLGVDAQFFKQLSVSVDGFLDKRSGIVVQENILSALYGDLPPYLNVGEMTIKGIEGMVTYNNKLGDFTYSASALAMYSNNTIDYAAEILMYENASATGNALGTKFGYEATGFYDISDFNPDGSLTSSLPRPTFGPVQPGDIVYNDISGDGFIDQADLVKIGDPYVPKAIFSLILNLNYKGFYVDVMFQGNAGRSINLLDMSDQTIAFADNSNAYPLIEDRWAYYPDQGIDTRASANYPRLSTSYNVNNYQPSTFWIKNGNFMKIRHIELGYSLPGSLTQNVPISGFRIYVSAINVFSFSSMEKNYSIDPEYLTGYPAMKSFIMGVIINL